MPASARRGAGGIRRPGVVANRPVQVLNRPGPGGGMRHLAPGHVVVRAEPVVLRRVAPTGNTCRRQTVEVPRTCPLSSTSCSRRRRGITYAPGTPPSDTVTRSSAEPIVLRVAPGNTCRRQASMSPKRFRCRRRTVPAAVVGNSTHAPGTPPSDHESRSRPGRTDVLGRIAAF